MSTLYSYNGWLASARTADFGGLDNLIVDGTPDVKLAPGVRNGDVAVVLRYVAAQLHRRVEGGIMPGCWGHAFRSNRNANNLSCHASATAFDWNAPKHPNGKHGTWTPAQLAEIHAILAEVNNVVKCGEFFSGTIDGMHFEIHGTVAQVAAVARRLREAAGAGNETTASLSPDVHAVPATPPAPADALADGILQTGERGPSVLAWQGELWRLGYGVGLHDGIFGPAVEAATRDLQAAAGIGVDGRSGPVTFERARSVPTYPKPDGPALPLCQAGGDRTTVMAFQQRFKDRGWSLAVDGDYGPRTREVITGFQRQVGLGADGVGGPQVWTAAWLRPIT